MFRVRVPERQPTSLSAPDAARLRGIVEPRVRALVADRLGVGPEELSLEVSLIEDLAADSLDLLEVGLALEAEFGVAIPDRVLDDVRSFGDLVHETLARVAVRERVAIDEATPAVPVHVRLAGGVEGRGVLEHSGRLTAYAAQTIIEDACRAGQGGRLEVSLAADADDATLQAVARRFGWLAERGLEVSVARERRVGARDLLRPRPRHGHHASAG